MRKRLFEIIRITDDPTRIGEIYDIAMIIIIIVSLIPLAFKHEAPLFHGIELFVGTLFIIDYLLHWIVADYELDQKGIGAFLRYPFTTYAIIAFISILPIFTALSSVFELLRLVRMARLFVVFRSLRVFRVFLGLRYFKGINTIIEVLKKQKAPLLAVATLAIGYILLSALLIFNVEPDSFPHFFDAIYWATISLTTVGYGDIYPVSIIGKLVTMLSSLIGIAIVALPAGIITAGYIEEIREEKKVDRELNEPILEPGQEITPKR
jgi:voltage-gated potassium channel